MTSNIYKYSVDTKPDSFLNDSLKQRLDEYIKSSHVKHETIYVVINERLNALIYIDPGLNKDYAFDEATTKFSKVSYFQIFYIKSVDEITDVTEEHLIPFVNTLSGDNDHPMTFIICTGNKEVKLSERKDNDTITIFNIRPNDRKLQVDDKFTLPNSTELNYIVVIKKSSQEGPPPAEAEQKETNNSERAEESGQGELIEVIPESQEIVERAESEEAKQQGPAPAKSEQKEAEEKDTRVAEEDEEQQKEEESQEEQKEEARLSIKGEEESPALEVIPREENVERAEKNAIQSQEVAEIKEEPTLKKKKSKFQIQYETNNRDRVQANENARTKKREAVESSINKLSGDQTSPYNKKGGKRRTKKNKGKKVRK